MLHSILELEVGAYTIRGAYATLHVYCDIYIYSCMYRDMGWDRRV